MTNQKDLINKNEESILKDTQPKNITIDDVLEFIEKNGEVYSYKIMKALEKFDNRGVSVEDVVSENRNMYERLSKL